MDILARHDAAMAKASSEYLPTEQEAMYTPTPPPNWNGPHYCGIHPEHALICCVVEIPDAAMQVPNELFTDERAKAIHGWILSRVSNGLVEPYPVLMAEMYKWNISLFKTVNEEWQLAHQYERLSPVDWPYWLSQMQEAYQLRETARVARNIESATKTQDWEALSEATRELEELKKAFKSSSVVLPPSKQTLQLVGDTMTAMSERYGMDKMYRGYSTGFNELDIKSDGLVLKTLWVMAGRPSVGKTTFGLNLTAALAVQNANTALFSLEMDKVGLMKKFLHIGTEIPQSKFSRRMLDAADFANFVRISNKCSRAPILFIDGVTSLGAITDQIRLLKTQHAFDVFIVDYLQKVLIPGSTDAKWQNIGRVSSELKSLAMELNVCIVALAQLSRDVDKEERRPTLSDLQHSSQIEADADVVVALWKEKGKLRMDLLKSRYGSVGPCPIEADYDTGRMWEPRETPC